MKDTKKEPAVFDIVGRAFVVLGAGEDGGPQIERQGIVRGRVTPDLLLVQYFSWIEGCPTTMRIIPVEAMVGSPLGDETSGSWVFFEDDEQMRFWMEEGSGYRFMARHRKELKQL